MLHVCIATLKLSLDVIMWLVTTVVICFSDTWLRSCTLAVALWHFGCVALGESVLSLLGMVLLGVSLLGMVL